MLQIEFKNDGRISVSAYQDGTWFDVTTDINKLESMVPAEIFNQLRDRMVAFLHLTANGRRLVAVPR